MGASQSDVPWLTHSGGARYEIHCASVRLCGKSSDVRMAFVTADRFDFVGPEVCIETVVDVTHGELRVRTSQWIYGTVLWSFRTELAEIIGHDRPRACLTSSKNDVVDGNHTWKMAFSVQGDLKGSLGCDIDLGIPDLYAENERQRNGRQGQIRNGEYWRTSCFVHCTMEEIMTCARTLDDLYRCLEVAGGM